MLEIHQIPALNDNYIYFLLDKASRELAVVDPSAAAPVLDELVKNNWKLKYIFNTHHHSDHVGGNLVLKEKTGCKIYASKQDARIPGVDFLLDEGDSISIGASNGEVFSIPGHTSAHIAYYFRESASLFCGDTIFSLGCGRVFDGTMEQLWKSLDRLRKLAPDTKIYCAHEYTLENALFARALDGANVDLQKFIAHAERLREENLPTVPSLLRDELLANPFLRPESLAIQEKLKIPAGTDLSVVFKIIRETKDRFDHGENVFRN